MSQTQSQTQLYNYLTYIFLIIIILSFSYFNSLNGQEKEGFAPRIREFYRPYVRNARNFIEGFYDKTKTNASNIFRKIGLM